ncbi:MAG: urea ABC transporter permease subunit UrtB, partial [Bradyrhizobium sp.]
MAALATAVLLLLAATLARADGFTDGLAKFAGDSFADTEAGIAAVAASGHARAQAVIAALQEGRLSFDPATRKILIKTPAGFADAATAEPVADAAALKPVRLNNRLRRAVEAALGGLTLLSADPGKRWEAAQAVFRSRDAAAKPALDLAIDKETVRSLKRALSEARAAVVLFSADASEADRLDAVATLR